MGLIILGGIIIFLSAVVVGFLLIYFIVAKVINVLFRNKSERFKKICVVLGNAVFSFVAYLIILPRVLSYNDIGDIYLNGAFLFGTGVVLFFLILFYWFIARQTQGNKPSLLSLEVPAILPIFLIFVYAVFSLFMLGNHSNPLSCDFIADPSFRLDCITDYIDEFAPDEVKAKVCDEKIKNTEDKEDCYSWAAQSVDVKDGQKLNMAINICKKIQNNPPKYGSCLDNVVRWNKHIKDPGICGEIKDGIGDSGGEDGRRFCYTTVATNTKNIKLCDKIERGGYRNMVGCVQAVAALTNNCADINFIEYVPEKDRSYFNVSNDSLMRECFEEAKRLHDAEIINR